MTSKGTPSRRIFVMGGLMFRLMAGDPMAGKEEKHPRVAFVRHPYGTEIYGTAYIREMWTHDLIETRD